MRLLLVLSILSLNSWAATITTGTFSAGMEGEPAGNSSNALIQWTLGGSSATNVTFHWQIAGAPVIIDPVNFPNSWTFSDTFTNLAPQTGTITIGGQTYTIGPNTSASVNMIFTAGPPISYALAAANCTPPVSGNFCASISGVPFTMTGSISVANNGSTIFSDTLTGSGTASAQRQLGDQVGFWEGTYSFSSVPEPATNMMLASGLGALVIRLRARVSGKRPV